MKKNKMNIRIVILGLITAAAICTACGSKNIAADNKNDSDQNSVAAADASKGEKTADPEKLQDYIDLHQSYLEAGDYEAAMQVLEDAWEAGVEDPQGKLVTLYTSLITKVQNDPSLLQSEDEDSDTSAAKSDAETDRESDSKVSDSFDKPRDFEDDTSYMNLAYTPVDAAEDEKYEFEDKIYWFLMNEDIRHIWEYADGAEKLTIVPGTFSDKKAVELVSLSIRGTVEQKDLAQDPYCESLGKNENGINEYKMSPELYLGYVDEYFGWERAEELGDIPEEYMIFTGTGIEDFSEMDVQLTEEAKCDEYVKAVFHIVYKWHYSAPENETRDTQVAAYFKAEQDGDYTYHVLLHADEI